jgi:hypothetical protein
MGISWVFQVESETPLNQLHNLTHLTHSYRVGFILTVLLVF